MPRRQLLAMAVGLALAARGARASSVWRAWPAGQRVPPLALPTADGRRWALSDQRGQAVLLNFWATWCEPCRDEMPSLARLAAQWAPQGLVVATVNYREAAATVSRFAERLGLALPLLLDADGEAARAWTPRVFPSTVLVGRDGRPQGTLLGEVDWDGDAARTRVAALMGLR